jgi:PPOX class probable F420-dependent enzyme
MATVRPDGRPHVVPFVFAVVEDQADVRLYWTVDRKRKRSQALERLRNIEHDPAVEVVVDGYDEDWGRLWWVRASGSGRVVTVPAEREKAISELRAKYPQYREEPLTGRVAVIDVAAIMGWTALPGL